MSYQVIANTTWTLLRGTDIQVLHAEGHNVPVDGDEVLMALAKRRLDNPDASEVSVPTSSGTTVTLHTRTVPT
ncbi:hypothetical protein [Phytohabitans aurantiacus]|uniref:Uncharacterized protein n=1 Tax=Phytohabitans aurantiacus TaxID=3016789 RepID=A0ABQ5QRV4_9ACTN|nr:hypothetical protein [Phytohabitans aurantiacus]GLH97361.1 hypothetical protein Pa4123_26360 [Phytohabitans aurantiacus]